VCEEVAKRDPLCRLRIVPVNVLLIEPIWNSVSGVTASGLSTLVTPNPW